MIARLVMFGSDLLRYLLLCLVCVASGMGLMRLIRLYLPLQLALVFAPVLTMALWSVGLGISVAWRIPVGWLAGPLWGLTGALAHTPHQAPKKQLAESANSTAQRTSLRLVLAPISGQSPPGL